MSGDGNSDPPELNIHLPKMCDLPGAATNEHPSLPVDILLVTVKDCEFLSCYAHLKNSFKCWFNSLGYVYFGDAVGDGDANVKIALMMCQEGSTGPGSSLITVMNAATVLRPKGVIAVGYCSGLSQEKTQLGDVVVSAKLTTYASKIVMPDNQEQSTGTRSLVSRRFLQLIRHVADGWKAPLKLPEEREVNVHRNGEFLSGPEKVSAQWRREQLVHSNPQAIAIEMEGEGLFAAAFDHDIEWLIVKGIADFADGKESTNASWEPFASAMAASVVFHFLSDPYVFKEWPHYQELPEQWKDEKGNIEDKLGHVEDVFDPAEIIDEIRQLYKSREGWLAPFPWCEEFHFHLDDIFTRLKVVSRKKTRGTATTDTVDMSGIFKPHEECQQPRTVLIEGKPGMGKSTYCQKLVYDWATGKQPAEDSFPRFELVLLLRCRDMKSADLWEAIDDLLLPRDVKEDVRERFFDFIRQNQSNVLLILDGLDEVPANKLPMFSEIVQGRVLPKCRLVATARHEAGIKLRIHCDTLLEIEGFTQEDAREFIIKFFKTNMDLAYKLLHKVISDETLNEMAANPLNTALLCLFCEEFQGVFPESRAELYVEIVQCVLRRYIKKKGLSEDNEDLIEAYKPQLKHLGWIALKGLLEDTLDFDESELGSHLSDLPGFGFLSVQPGGSKLRPRRRYGFLHKSFQEWFAAFYLCCQLLDKEISTDSLASDRRYFHELVEVLKFTCGLLAARCEETTTALIKSIMTQVNHDAERFPVVLECIIECKKEHSDFYLSLARVCGTEFCGHHLHLDLTTEDEAIVLAEAFKSNSSITCLNLSSNIGDDCVTDVVEALKGHSNLAELIWTGSDIGDETATGLAETLKENSSLTQLDLSYNAIFDDGAAALAEALRNNSSLTELDLVSNSIGDAGAAALAEALLENVSLTELDLSDSTIDISEELITKLRSQFGSRVKFD